MQFSTVSQSKRRRLHRSQARASPGLRERHSELPRNGALTRRAPGTLAVWRGRAPRNAASEPSHRCCTRRSCANDAGVLVGDAVEARVVALRPISNRRECRQLIERERERLSHAPVAEIERLGSELDALRAPIVRRILAIGVGHHRTHRTAASLFDHACRHRGDGQGRCGSQAANAALPDAAGGRSAVACAGARRADRRVAGATTVIAGFGGELISHAYLEEHVLPERRGARCRLRTALVRWWQRRVALARPRIERARRRRRRRRPAAAAARPRSPGDRPRVRRPARIPADPRTACCSSCRGRGRPPRAWRDAVRCGLATAGGVGDHLQRPRRCASSTARDRGRAPAIEFDFERADHRPARHRGAMGVGARGRAVRRRARRRFDRTSIESDAHASRVCRSLGDGVLSALPRLTIALGRASRDAPPIARSPSIRR